MQKHQMDRDKKKKKETNKIQREIWIILGGIKSALHFEYDNHGKRSHWAKMYW